VLSCSSAGLRAIQQHVTLRHRPRACAGLTSLQVNEAVARAIREAVGPLPKPAGRRLALRDSKYLAGLVTTIPPGKPVTAGTGPAERSGETQAGLAGLAGWERSGDEIVKTYECASFPAAVAFVVQIGFAAEARNHHPDLDIRWRKVKVALTTHDSGGLTDKDIELATVIETLS